MTRSEAARINGAKSRGPATPAGKARSAMNATTHGLTARDHRLATEDREAYEQNLQVFINHFRPATTVDAKLVHLLAGLHWRIHRAEAIEASLIDMEMDMLAPEIEKTFYCVDADGLSAIGYKSLTDRSTVLANLDRQQTRLFRQFDRIRRHLARARNENLQNEPVAEPPNVPNLAA
ncbi:MAG: hypothetical protein SFV51_16310 [Bryobacteraceae bacterium]|nr:hypothetical protein [Bryobacteraceae bacterium]